MDDQPLVSIGIPTYNRALSLRRAVRSALDQDYSNIEVVISDNASIDETEATCREFSRLDSRVRYLRQKINQGPTANFHQVLHESRGEYFMWLADDDWLDRSYVSRCVEAFRKQPDYALVSGGAKYFQGEKFSLAEAPVNLLQDSGKERVLAYYRQVCRNGTFYGVMRREHLIKRPLQNVLGEDWLLVAHIAFIGKVKAVENVWINRAMDGSSEDVRKLALMCGVSGFMARNPHLKIATTIFKDIVWMSPIYKSIGVRDRLSLGWRAAVAICVKYSVPVWKRRLLGERNADISFRRLFRTALRKATKSQHG